MQFYLIKMNNIGHEHNNTHGFLTRIYCRYFTRIHVTKWYKLLLNFISINTLSGEDRFEWSYEWTWWWNNSGIQSPTRPRWQWWMMKKKCSKIFYKTLIFLRNIGYLIIWYTLTNKTMKKSFWKIRLKFIFCYFWCSYEWDCNHRFSVKE